MFKSLSPVSVLRIIVTLIICTTVIGGAWGLYQSGKSAGAQQERAAHLAASLAAEISLSKRQKAALTAASKENQKLVEDLWNEISDFSQRISSVRSEVRNLPRIQEMNCAPGSDRVDIVNRTLSD